MFCSSPRDPPAPPLPPAPPVMGVARRNERERKRVRLVNMGFARLRQFVPGHRPGKRLSKVETLRAAIHYIRHLRQILGEADKPWDAPLHQRSFPPIRRGPYEEEMGPYGQVPLVCEGAPWGPFVWTPVEAPCQYEDRVEVSHPAYVPEYLY